MTEKKLRQLHKLLGEFQREMDSGILFVGDSPNSPLECNREQYGAEVVTLIRNWVWRFIP